MNALAAVLALGFLTCPLAAADRKPELVGAIVGSGKPVYLNDRITTGAAGRLQIRLKDDTLFTIGPNSSVVIDEFVYDPSTGLGRVAARILEGVFQFVTGKVGMKKPENMKVRLPACTIGINGTEVMGRVEPGRDTVILRSGAIVVGNDAGRTPLTRSAYAVTVDGGQAPSAAFPAPLPLLTSLMKALTDAKPASAAKPDSEGPLGDRLGCSRAFAKDSPKALLAFKACVQRKAAQAAALQPAENLVYFDELVDTLEKLGDAGLAEALKRLWLAQLEQARAIKSPAPPLAQWLLRQELPVRAYRSAGPRAQEAKDALAARYGLGQDARARLDRLFQ